MICITPLYSPLLTDMMPYVTNLEEVLAAG